MAVERSASYHTTEWLLLLLAACGSTQPVGTMSLATYTPSTNNSGISEAQAWLPNDQ